MRRATFVYVVLMVALATLLAYPMALLVPGKVEAFVLGYLLAVAFMFAVGVKLWKGLRRTFRA